MTIPYITIGCPTTGGGQVIEGDSSFLIEGVPIACLGHKATCPLHKRVSKIIGGCDDHMIIMGKPAALANALLDCGCRCLPKQNLVVGDNGGGSGSGKVASQLISNFVNATDSFGQRFLLKDELTGEPLANVCYEIIKNGETIHGTTDEQGYTEIIASDSAESIEINIIGQGHSHG
ncbi:PAAR domain-containing protein [Acinetobacter stercoris]|uniref:PAAR motif protein n=1 Tax=Acinetobacter stercoris TaxID=2126983 RepID=A0A2U3N1A0_9GAMM|nr:PAAR domain-containing protein [Acinetobacter stercoris]SPL71442.1 PAAR motif protein [Acinetobacter stercoris]